jgi:VIT1/CCC1 family predicted Fe2+/Mn2+ transporter
LKSFIYGGLDGTVNTLTIIVGGIAASTSSNEIMRIGIAAMVGDGLGMGLGDYLSGKAEKEFILSEEKRELWEVDNQL